MNLFCGTVELRLRGQRRVFGSGVKGTREGVGILVATMLFLLSSVLWGGGPSPGKSRGAGGGGRVGSFFK